MQLLMEAPVSGKRFILSAANVSYREIFNLIADAFGKKKPHKQVTGFLAAIVWRVEAIKAIFTGKDPLLTKETAKTAQAYVRFNNSKLLETFPEFAYTPLPISITRICAELKKKYSLN
ncbi:MAG: NAD-dependent epimerase/dehydratase family protein, partial [Sediminibacterium sp.]